MEVVVLNDGALGRKVWRREYGAGWWCLGIVLMIEADAWKTWENGR